MLDFIFNDNFGKVLLIVAVLATLVICPPAIFLAIPAVIFLWVMHCLFGGY